jgi:hypothetical protein
MRKNLEAPTNPADVVGWVDDAVQNGRHLIDDHYYKRCNQRGLPPQVWKRVLRTMTSCTPYAPDRGPLAGGTSWRITGQDFEGAGTAIGVETFADHLGRRAIIITVF